MIFMLNSPPSKCLGFVVVVVVAVLLDLNCGIGKLFPNQPIHSFLFFLSFLSSTLDVSMWPCQEGGER